MENKERDRMIKLSQSLQQTGEVFKEGRQETNSEKITEEFKRLSELASGAKTSAIREALDGGFMGSSDSVGFNAVTQSSGVNSIIDNLYNNPNLYKGAQGNNISIKDNEALDICIKRTLESGAPINNLNFYDEINWNLSQLGFSTKLPQDIKTAIINLIK